MAKKTVCVACGSETSVQRQFPYPELGGVSVDEVETMVGNEWRHAFGRAAHDRSHQDRLVRALIAYALAPESPVRDLIAERRIHLGILMLGGHGLGREAIVAEFAALSQAARKVLGRIVDRGRATQLVDRINGKLQDVLRWPM